ncbi:MAG: ABC transporter ATP-binding protein [Mogibacterium sp.]|nr:ABC transporter ATP-binding protein [Mogibacterium sp.]
MSGYIEKARGIFRSPALQAIGKWIRPIRGNVIAIMMIGMINSMMGLTVTMVTKTLIDSATSGRSRDLWIYGAALAGLIIAERGMSILNARIRLRTGTRFQKEMQQNVTRALMGKEYTAIKPFHSGQLVNRVFSDVNVVKGGVMNLLPSIATTAVSFIGAAIILITMDWRFVPVMILAGGIGVAMTIGFREPMKRRHKRMQEAEDALHASTQETIENVKLIKASVSEEYALEEIDEYREKLQNEQIRNGRLSILMNNGMGSMFDLSWLICYLWGCVKIFQGQFTYGSLAALIQLVGRIQSPIANAVNLVSQAYGVISSAERLTEIIEMPDEEVGTTITDFDAIRMEEMSFQYEDGNDDILIGVNAEIRKGDFVALTGRSGGGKTSLFQLMLGIYRPTSGKIYFESGGKKIPACRGTRGLFAYVPQGNTLFSGTIRENILKFNPEASEERIEAAIDAACLRSLADEVGMDAPLGERGIGLSEGQAQRVAVARALVSEAPILLLDEATSALDEATEAVMLENIGKMREKTVIIVTHRRAALGICDYEIKIEDGRVKSDGREAGAEG